MIRILIPINGSEGTRNPDHRYDMMSSNDKKFMKKILRKRKRENPEIYKTAFLVDSSTNFK
jgi:hypothetical protein